MKYYKTVWVEGKQIRTHRHIMELHLGRKLSRNELVHHINGNMFDNRIENLQIISRSDHIKKHPEISELSLKKRQHNLNIGLIKKMYKTKPIREIAKYFKVSPMTIWYRLKQNNIETNKIGFKYKNK